MKIIEASADALTNFKSLDLLRSRGTGKYASRAIATVSQSEFKVFDYLEGTVACNQTREIIDNFVAECQEFDLAKVEILNILNIRPRNEPKLFPLIEECESRMEDKAEELVETITRILPPHPSQVAEANEEAAEGEEEETEP
ncbi:DNA-directed RNA polymerase III subunit rpc9-like [Salvia splendens]|uniref:DNA-directed RNA polymerase III subunit rpc9-like n=1 Tax=Salvia splendens TaxID=180675 RepID=UPI001C2627A5|nr:DNA-directed RNA polymerase III subunit rpc9-like [Salvia splendens]